MTNSVRELMEIYGFKYTGTCHCNGARTLKYKKGELEFRWRINQYKFRLREGLKILKNWSPVRDAEETLKQLPTA